jgi:hypothetical protein
MMSRGQRGGEEMSNNQSSVEWLMDKLFDPSYMQKEQLEWFEQAKAMHKEEIKQALIDGSMNSTLIEYRIPQYYNETFEK